MHQIQFKCGNCGHQKVFEISLDVIIEIKCDRCKFVSSVILPINGYIYVLSNPCMPGIVKIGFTTRSVEERVKELNSASGVPDSFDTEAIFISNNPKDDETKIHSEFSAIRVNENREFFQIDTLLAANRISEILGYAPSFTKYQVELNRKNEEKVQKQNALESLGIYLNDPGPKIASYSFICKKCEYRYYSRTPKNHKTMCPNCFSKMTL